MDYLLPQEYTDVLKVLHSNAPQSKVKELETVRPFFFFFSLFVCRCSFVDCVFQRIQRIFLVTTFYVIVDT